MKVVITGSSGFYGTHLMDVLFNNIEDIEIVGIDTDQRLNDFPVDPFTVIRNQDALNKRFKRISMDFRELNSDKIDSLNSDYIIHLAALVSIPESMKIPLDYFQVNEYGTFNLCQELVKTKTQPHLIYASSPEVYGNPSYTPIDIDHPFRPRSFYAASKLAAEKHCMVLHEWYDYPVTVVRNFNTYGENQSNTYRGFPAVVPDFITKALTNKKLTIHDDGNQTRDLMYVKDAVDAYKRVIEKNNESKGQTFNIGTGIQTSIKDLAQKIISISDSKSEIDFIEGRPADLERLEADISKTSEILDWSPKFNIEDGLKITIKWYKNLIDRE